MTRSSAWLVPLVSLVSLTLGAALGAPAFAGDKQNDSDQAYEHRSRGQQLERTGHQGAALVEYRTALRFDRNDVESSWRAGVIELRLGHAQAAIPLLERAVRGNLDAGGGEEIDLARAYEQVNKVEEARRVLEREAAENPTYVRVHLSLIGLLARHGHCDEAQALMAKMEKHPSIDTKDLVSWADDARTEVRARCVVQAKR
jgi:lipopolysaccharide biosynthesis regulator YciM